MIESASANGASGRAIGVQLGQLVGDLLIEVADLRLQLLDVLEDVGLAGLVQLLLSQREVADRLVGEGVGDAHGVLGVSCSVVKRSVPVSASSSTVSWAASDAGAPS